MVYYVKIMANKILNQAKEAKNDEFYTQMPDIENELRHYRAQFKGKTVLCNCDDPRISNFFRYFALNFEFLGLKKLICTCYKHQDIDIFTQHENEEAVYMVYEGNTDGDYLDFSEVQVKPLKGDGDFRSPECVELLKEADIVVTNPPFSLFREYIAQLMHYDKKFLVLGRMSALHYSEIFSLIMQDKIWTGYGFNLSMVYKTPYENNLEANKKYVKSKGYNPDDNYIKVPAICWYTNLDTTKRHEEMILFKKYTEEEYPKYMNYDGIDVGKVTDIPGDYWGDMGVPDTFLDRYNPEQFEIVGLGCGDLAKRIGITKNHRGRTDLAYTVNGVNKCPYSRIVIRRKR